MWFSIICRAFAAPLRNAAALFIALVAWSVTQYRSATAHEPCRVNHYNAHPLFSAYKVGHVDKVTFLDSLDNARNTYAVVRDVNLARGIRAGVERADVGGTALAARPLVDFLNHTLGVEARGSLPAVDYALMRKTWIDYLLRHTLMPLAWTLIVDLVRTFSPHFSRKSIYFCRHCLMFSLLTVQPPSV